MDGGALLFRCSGRSYSCDLVCEARVRPRASYLRSSCAGSLVFTLAGLREPRERSFSQFRSLHLSLLSSHGPSLLPRFPAGCCMGRQLGQRLLAYLDVLLCLPHARGAVEEWLDLPPLEGVQPPPPAAERRKRPIVLIGGVAVPVEGAETAAGARGRLRARAGPGGAEGAAGSAAGDTRCAQRVDKATAGTAASGNACAPRLALVTVLLHRADTPLARAVAQVQWADNGASGSAESPQVAETARLMWHGRPCPVKIAASYRQLWQKPPGQRRRVRVLQPGCVLIRAAMSAEVQQELLDEALALGGASAGFYVPAYPRSGLAYNSSSRDAPPAERHMKLRLCCVGRHWDHINKGYADVRANIDGLPVPPLPHKWADLAIEYAGVAAAGERTLAAKRAGGAAPADGSWSCQGVDVEVAEDEAGETVVSREADEPATVTESPPAGEQAGPASPPPFRPDVALINLYGRDGTLGLHQDCHESAASLKAGTPVVSLSVGDSCAFILGPPAHHVGGLPPHPSECQFVRLRSGDALVLAGPSRLAFHGVSHPITKSAPGYLRLPPERPCRINITCRDTGASAVWNAPP